MIPHSRISIPQSKPLLFPKDILLLREFKALLNSYISRLGVAQRFKPRLYTYADFVLVKFYGLSSEKSTEIAAEKLNWTFYRHYQEKFNLDPKRFSDGKRRRRLVPHQTDVDKFFRLLSEKEVQYIFGNLLMHLVRQIKIQQQMTSTVRYIADNTEYAYYGETNSIYDLGTNRKAGTRRCRLFQGHAIYGNGITLYTNFNLHQIGVYRSRYIDSEIGWLRFNGFRLSYALLDREFYRASLVKRLKIRHLPLIMPAKKYPVVMRAFKEYLNNRRNLAEPYLFSQGSKSKPYPTKALVHLVIIGNNEVDPAEIRKNYNKGFLTLKEALKKLAGFFVTGKPWINQKRWGQWLIKAYKQRWNIETGFAKLNSIHESYRNRYPIVQLAQLYMRAFIYNNWQHYRREGQKIGLKSSVIALNEYKVQFARSIFGIINQSVRKRTSYLIKSKKEVYFQT